MKGLKPLSSLYEKLTGFKNFLYDKEYLHAVTLPIPVLSLGNLTMGGTGKTPMTDFCLQYFKKHQVKTVVVSRNYRAEVGNIAQVDVQRPQAAAYFGDEPVLLASRHPEVDFFVGPQKFLTAQYAYGQRKPELVIVDDGFQHRQLFRNVDILILDATESLENYECVPVGRARESWQAIARTSAIAITKVNLARPEEVQALMAKLQGFQKPISTFSYETKRLCQVQGPSQKNLSACEGQKVMLVSGIGRPKSFEQNLQKYGLQLEHHFVFKDHHPYTSVDVQEILRKWKAKGAESLLVTTEKDQVKLKELWPLDVPLWFAPLEVQIQSEEKAFYEVLDQVRQ